MVKLAAYLFGAMRLTEGPGGAEIPLQPTPRRLLGFLAVHRSRTMQRDAVAETLWPDQDPGNARRCLNSALFRLRQAVSTCGAPLPLHSPSSEEIAITAGDGLWLDIDAFETGLSGEPSDGQSLSEDRLERMESSVSHYRSPLLDGIDDEWAARERRRVEGLYLDARHLLAMQCRRRRHWDRAIAHARHVLDVDPLREDIHGELIRSLYGRGDRSQAIRQYETLKTLLWNELQVTPMPQTERLFRLVSSGEILEAPRAGPAAVPRPDSAPAGIERNREHMRSMRQRIQALQRDSQRLLQTANDLERLVERFDRELSDKTSQ